MIKLPQILLSILIVLGLGSPLLAMEIEKNKNDDLTLDSPKLTKPPKVEGEQLVTEENKNLSATSQIPPQPDHKRTPSSVIQTPPKTPENQGK